MTDRTDAGIHETKTLKKVSFPNAPVYLGFLIFYIWLAAQIPYTHDDWDWGLDVGIQQLLTANINSRYVGNFFVIIMTRSKLVQTIIMGAGFFLLPFLLSETVFGKSTRWTKADKLNGFLLSNALILSMNISIWQQTYGWVSGYANFGLSAIFLCIILRRCLNVFDETPSESNKFHPRVVLIFLTCLAGQLFLENMAIYIFLMAIFINIFHWRRTKTFSCAYMAILLAALIGLVIMFSSSLYQTLWSTGEAVNGYRQLLVNSQTNLQDFVLGCFRQILRIPFYLYANNTFLCAAIVVLMSILCIQNKKTCRQTKVCMVLNSLLVICLILSNYLSAIVGSFISVLFFVTVTGELIWYFKENKPVLGKMLFVWISPVCIILPIVVTSELGSRLFFTTNAILVLFALFLLSFTLKSASKKGYYTIIFSVIAGLLLLQHGAVYYAIGECSRERNAIIENAVQTNADEILLPQYPYGNYLWGPNPTKASREQYFKEFYGIAADVSVEIEGISSP